MARAFILTDRAAGIQNLGRGSPGGKSPLAVRSTLCGDPLVWVLTAPYVIARWRPGLRNSPPAARWRPAGEQLVLTCPLEACRSPRGGKVHASANAVEGRARGVMK